MMEEQEDFPLFVYHVTFSNNLDSIMQFGLNPQAGGALGRGGYAEHSHGRLFLTEQQGVGFWYDRMEAVANDLSDEPLADGYVPVVLKVPSYEQDMQEDEAGTSDANAQSWYMTHSIEPDEIEVWNGESWVMLDEWSSDYDEQAFDDEGYFVYQDQNPLANPDYEAD